MRNSHRGPSSYRETPNLWGTPRIDGRAVCFMAALRPHTGNKYSKQPPWGAPTGRDGRKPASCLHTNNSVTRTDGITGGGRLGTCGLRSIRVAGRPCKRWLRGAVKLQRNGPCRGLVTMIGEEEAGAVHSDIPVLREALQHKAKTGNGPRVRPRHAARRGVDIVRRATLLAKAAPAGCQRLQGWRRGLLDSQIKWVTVRRRFCMEPCNVQDLLAEAGAGAAVAGVAGRVVEIDAAVVAADARAASTAARGGRRGGRCRAQRGHGIRDGSHKGTRGSSYPGQHRRSGS